MKPLTKKESEVMNILWKEHPLSASQIQKRYSELSIYSIQQLIQRLMDTGFIKVECIDYSGKKLSRFFAPNVSEYSTHSEPHRPALRATYSII